MHTLEAQGALARENDMKRIDATDPNTIRYKFRKKRFAKIEATIREFLTAQEDVKVLDIGGRRDYWEYLSADLRPKVHITLVNFEYELENYDENVDGLQFELCVGDGCDLPQFEDQSFDLVHSNSVIEHVGSMARMAQFAKETRRLGRAYYVQTPYLWFPLEPHFGVPFFHWLPAPSRAQLVHKFNVGFSNKIENFEDALAEIDTINLVDKGLMKRLFPEATLMRERFALMTKSLIMLKGPAET